MAKKATPESAIAAMLETLTPGETVIVQAIKTSNPNKVQLEFAEKMTALEENPGALLGLLNQSDDRFTSGARRGWITAEVADAGSKLNLNCGDDADWETNKAGKEVLILGVKNPKIGELRLRLRINETLVPTEYQKENLETSAKRKGADGDFITHKGKYIFSNTEIVPMSGDANPTHIMLVADSVSVKSIVDETADL